MAERNWMKRKRSPLIWCAKDVLLPDSLRDTSGSVMVYCSVQENDQGEIIPEKVGISPHGLKHDDRGMHNVCGSKICVHNTQLRPPNRLSIFDFLK